MPGWAAFLYASCAVRWCAGVSFDTWYDAALSAISVVTTLLFIFGSPWVILRGSQSLRRAFAWVAATAFVINAHWYISFWSTKSDLGIGYYLWWLSFAVLATGLFDPEKQTNESAQSAALPRPAAGS